MYRVCLVRDDIVPGISPRLARLGIRLRPILVKLIGFVVIKCKTTRRSGVFPAIRNDSAIRLRITLGTGISILHRHVDGEERVMLRRSLGSGPLLS